MKYYTCVWIALAVTFEGNKLSYVPDVCVLQVTAQSEAEAVRTAWERVKSYPDRLEYTTEEMLVRELKRSTLEEMLNDEPQTVCGFPEIVMLKNPKDESILDLDYLDV